MAIQITPKPPHKLILLPDGQRADLDGAAYAVVSTTLTIILKAGGTVTSSVSNGANVLLQLDDIAINGADGTNPIPIYDSTLTWTSVTPSTATVGVAYSGVIAGTGFMLSGINEIKIDDGAGNITRLTGSFLDIVSDVEIDIPTGFTPAAAGTYVLYYSTNSGGIYTTTGKTIVAS